MHADPWMVVCMLLFQRNVTLDRRLRRVQQGTCFVAFRWCVPSCARSGCLAGFDVKTRRLPFPCPFCSAELSLSPSPHPPTSYPALLGLIGHEYCHVGYYKPIIWQALYFLRGTRGAIYSGTCIRHVGAPSRIFLTIFYDSVSLF